MIDRWALVEVAIREARDVADANAQARRSGAYRQILRDHPSEGWEREHVVTEYDPGCGFWMVRFRVRRRPD